MKKAAITLTLALCVLVLGAGVAFAKTTIRFATPAPDGSLQVKVMKAMAKKISKATGGEVTFKIFAGGTVGDDLGVLRKIKLGHIDGGGFSGVGIGQILPEGRIWELPFFYTSDPQIDCIRDKLPAKHDFAKKFEEKGYVLLAWAGTGDVNLFSAKPIRSIADMKGTKPWAYKGDPIGQTTFAHFGLAGTELQLQDVLTSLQTGLIDTFYNAPSLTIALQWHVHAKYMLEQPLVYGSGAVLLKKDVWDALPAEHQQVIRDVFAEWTPKMVKKIRQQNRKSIGVMKEQGLEVVVGEPAQVKKFRAAGDEIAKKFVGKLFSQELLDEVIKLRATCK